MKIRYIFFLLFVYFVFKIFTAANVYDPLGFCFKHIQKGYYLEEFDGLYNVQKGRGWRNHAGCGYLDGVVDRMKVDDRYIYANVKRSTNELNGIYRIDCENGMVEGPLDMTDQEDFVPIKEMFDSLWWHP